MFPEMLTEAELKEFSRLVRGDMILSQYYDLALDDENLKIKVWMLKPDSYPIRM
jgi:hypothetical protein